MSMRMAKMCDGVASTAGDPCPKAAQSTCELCGHDSCDMHATSVTISMVRNMNQTGGEWRISICEGCAKKLPAVAHEYAVMVRTLVPAIVQLLSARVTAEVLAPTLRSPAF